MTIAITLNNVHQTNRHDSSSHNMSHTNDTMKSSPSKVRPYRKLQQYHGTASTMNDAAYNKYCRPQILSNGFTILPMLSLHDAALLNERVRREQQQQQQHMQSQQQVEQQYHHHSERPSCNTNQYMSSSFPLQFEHPQQRQEQHSHSHASDIKDVRLPPIFPTMSTSPFSSIYQQHEQQRNDLPCIEDSSTSSITSSSSMSSVQFIASVSNFSNNSMNNNEHHHHHDQQQAIPTSKHAENLTTMKVRKQVQFAPMATVHTRPLMTDEDIYNSWYSVQDYNTFEHDNRRVVSYIYTKLQHLCQTNELSKVSLKVLTKHLMEILNNKKYNNYCITNDTNIDTNNNDNTDDKNSNNGNNSLQYQVLGLEQFIFGPKYMTQYRQETMEHNIMVLEIYDVQRSCNIYNPDIVRRVSERFSYHKVDRAIHRAQHSSCFCSTNNATAA